MVRKLKALNAPAFWRVEKKKTTWVVSPSPGPHKKFECIPLSIILRNILKIAENGKEASTIIKGGAIAVDNKIVRSPSYPVGLFDTISLTKDGRHYRMVPSKKGLEIVEIKESEANVKVCRINDKTALRKGKLQLNLNDGKNILADGKEYRTGDSLLLELPSLKVVKHLKLKQGAVGMVVKGTDSGKLGTVEKVLAGSMTQPSKLVCRLGKESEEVLKDRFFVLGEDKPLITVVGK